jgi:SprT-like family
MAAHSELKPRTPLPTVAIEYFPFAGLNHTAQFRENHLKVRVSDLFVDAPQSVIHALALILLAKLYRRKLTSEVHETYRGFILSADIQERASAARRSRGRAPAGKGPSGRYVDLDVCFDRLNGRYFGGGLSKPRITWSERRSRRTLGRYDATRHCIYISRVFDTASVPPFVVDYVMFHEMLHVKHQSCIRGCRILVHTPEFRADEKSFSEYQHARQWLKTI